MTAKDDLPEDVLERLLCISRPSFLAALKRFASLQAITDNDIREECGLERSPGRDVPFSLDGRSLEEAIAAVLSEQGSQGRAIIGVRHRPA